MWNPVWAVVALVISRVTGWGDVISGKTMCGLSLMAVSVSRPNLWVKYMPLTRVKIYSNSCVHSLGWVMVWFQLLARFCFQNGFKKEKVGYCENGLKSGFDGKNGYQVPKATVDGKSSSGFKKEKHIQRADGQNV
jgi:hypothetical protein